MQLGTECGEHDGHSWTSGIEFRQHDRDSCAPGAERGKHDRDIVWSEISFIQL